VKDTDCDTLSDGDEVATWQCGDARNHADPLVVDTDGDGLPDSKEDINTTLPCSSCPYVNDDDSDDDGLQDGYEDKSKDGQWGVGGSGITIGTSTTQASKTVTDWETHLCGRDTDGDGLSDGQEEWMFGAGEVTPWGVSVIVGVQGPPLGNTVPALDSDMDNDGLSDEAETNTYQTDPMDADTDNDMVSDGAEVATWAYADSRNHSNPREADTDGDGLTDNLEVAAGCNCGTGTDGYVNDDDSDDDGLQDGREYQLFGAGADVADASGNDGELSGDLICCLCDPDSDDDGLKDGEEDSIGTYPRDWDSDDDGLSDREELQVYFTNPLDPDTDGDGAEGILTERPAEGESLLNGYAGPTHTASITKYDCISGTSVTRSVTFYTGMELKSDGVEAVSRTGQFPFDALGDQLDPLQGDTDGDGIGDATEFAPGCGGCSGGTGGLYDGFANNDDSDGDGLGDYLDAKKDVPTAVNVDQKPSDRAWIAWPEPQDADGFLGTTDAGLNDGELDADEITGICDPDSDGDGILDGLEHQIGTDPYDWDTDDDGRGDGEELTGGGPIPSDPADFDTDDDGLGDGVEVYGANPTNPVNADTDSDGLSDGGVFTPSAVAGIDGSGTSPLCTTGVPDHPNPYGYGEDENGDGAITAGETNPNDPDSDDDALGDGVEKLAYSTSRQGSIPATDLFGRAITVNYPPTGSTITYPDCSCLDPLNPDTDGDKLDDGVEDLNHDGNFDFASSDFDFDVMPLLGPPHPDPEETNPCDPDTDHDGLTDYEERNPSSAYPFNPTNPLDHDTDNDWLTDGYEVHFTCTVTEFSTLDNDLDGRLDEDPVDGIDNDGDGLIDEDPVDFAIRSVPVLNPTDRDSDSDGFIDGLDEDPCNSDLIPVLFPALGEPTDSDGDGFADIDELLAGTSEFDPEDHPVAFGQVDLDFDECIDDRIWLEPFLVCCQPVDLAHAIAIDLDDNVLLDLRLAMVTRNVTRGDFDDDGYQDDVRYVIEYLLSNYRAVQAKIVATITDFDGDLVIDRVVVERK
jgi:hypothetical protein